MPTPQLPGYAASPLTPTGHLSKEWYRYLKWVGERDTSAEADSDDAEYKLVGPLSIVVSGLLQNGLASVALKNDQLAPGATSYYGTDDSGAKGWHLVGDALDVTADLTKAVDGTTNVVTFGLADLPDSGVGASLVKITRDAKGRVEGTQAANLADLDDVAATAPSDGQVLTYDTTNGWQPETPASGTSAWTTVKKTADENRASTTTLADDSQLLVALNAGARYIIRVKVYFLTANATMDYKIAPAYSGTIVGTPVHHRKFTNPGASASFDNEWTGVVQAAINSQSNTAVATSGVAIYESEIIFQSNAAGTFSIQWAQNTSDPASLTVLAGSYLEYMAV